MAENEKRLAEAQREKEDIQRRIKENQEYEREQDRILKEKHMKYQDDLIQQIRYNQRFVKIICKCKKNPIDKDANVDCTK